MVIFNFNITVKVRTVREKGLGQRALSAEVEEDVERMKRSEVLNVEEVFMLNPNAKAHDEAYDMRLVRIREKDEDFDDYWNYYVELSDSFTRRDLQNSISESAMHERKIREEED